MMERFFDTSAVGREARGATSWGWSGRLLGLLLGVLLGLLPRPGRAQAPAFCTASATPAPTPALAFTTSFQSTGPVGSGTAPYWRFSAVAGETYSFSTCTGAVLYTEVRVYSPAGTVLAQGNPFTGANPYCAGGNKASLDWTCPSSGTYWLLVSYYGCNSLYANTTLEYKSSAATVGSPPTLSSLAPSSGGTGTLVTLTGTSLNDVYVVRFGSWSTFNFTAAADGLSLTVRVPAGAQSGPVTVQNLFGQASTGPFTLTENAVPNLVRVEYWTDTDPGIGLATPLALPGGTTTQAAGLTFQQALSGLTSGYHTVGVRSRDANGAWSLTNRRGYFVETSPATPVLARAEYFLDTDPGLGLATTLPVPTGSPNASGLTVAVPLSGLAPGYHSLGVRSQDANRVWSLTNRRAFYVEAGPLAAPNLRRAEYFLDADPGSGNGTPLTLPTNSTDSGPQTFAVSLAGLAPGFHSLAVRTQDVNRVWSITNRRLFFLDATPALANLRRAEYFLDADPGLGLATAISLPSGPTTDAAGVQFAVSLGSLSSGFHVLGVRSQDANRVWGLTNRRVFYYDNLAPAPDLARVEYFLDTDPGLGLATAITPLPGGPDASGLSIAVPLGGLTPGYHLLGVRSRSVGGRWSLTNRRPFFYEPTPVSAGNITRAEFFVDGADPGLGLATAMTLGGTGPDVSATGTGPALSALADGKHLLSVRSRDADRRWSVSNRQFFLKNGCTAALNVAAVVPGALSTTTATGSYSYVPTRIFDNSAVSSSSFSFSGPVIVTTDLGGPRTLNEVRYTLRNSDSGNPDQNVTVAVQTTTDFTTWTTQDTYAPVLAAGQSPLTVGRVFAAPVAGVRGLRLNLNLNPANSYSVQLYDFGAYNFPGCNTLPTITSFTPTSGPAGTSVTITGTNLGGTTQVLFDGTPVAAGSLTVNSASSLTVLAPAGGTSGQLTVITPQGRAYSQDSYVYPPAITNTFVTLYQGNGCTTSLFQVNFTTNVPAFGSGNVFRFQLSDANGVFTNSSRLYGALNQTITSTGGNLRDSVAFRTPSGTGYKFRVVSSNPVVYGDPSTPTTTIYAPPAATATTSAAQVPYQGTFTLTAGPAGLPANYYAWYYLNSLGNQYFIGNGQTITYSGAGVTDANRSGFYWVQVRNASINNCPDSASVRVKVLAPGVPVLAMGSFAGSRCAGSQQQFNFSVSGVGFNAGNVISAELSDGNGSFASPTVLASTPFSGTGGGSFTITFPSNLPAANYYRVRVTGSSPYTVGNDNGYNLAISPAPTATPSSNSPVTYGSTLIQLSTPAVANAGYQWTGPNGFSSTLREPTVPLSQTSVGTSTYQVVVTANNLCQAGGTTNVTVNPSAQPILTLTSVGIGLANGGTGSYSCGGNQVSLSYTVAGNSYAAGNTIVGELSDASGSFASPVTVGSMAFTGQGNGVLIGTLPYNLSGTGYRLRVRSTQPAVVSNDNGTNLTLRPTPQATASSNSPVPFGGTVQLSTPAVSGATYAWTGPGGFSSALREPTIANASQNQNQGTYQVTVTLNGCYTSAQTNVLVSPSTDPILSIAQFSGTLCGGTVLNTSFTVQGNNFGTGNVVRGELSDGNGDFSSPTVIGSVGFVGQGGGLIALTIPTLVPSNSGYRIRLTGSNPAGVVSINDNGTNLLLKPQADAVAGSNSPVPAGGDINLTANVVSGAAYQWTGPAGFSSNLPNPQIQNATAANQGTYTLSVTLNGCQRVSQTAVVIGAASQTLTVAQFSGQFCPGSSFVVPFTASGFSSGNVFTAELSDNVGQFTSPVGIGSVAGTSSGSINVVFPASTPPGTGYRIRVIASAPTYVSSGDNGSNLTIIPTTYVWTGGANSTDWFSAQNWSCGQIPTSTSVVVIPGGLNYYPVVAGGPASAGTLTVNLGATLTVSTTMNLYGNVTVNGTVVGGVGSTWAFVGGLTQYVYGNSPLQVVNLTVGGSSVINLSNALYVSGNWTNNGGTLLSNSQTVTFNGSTQVIGGTASTSFGNVVVNSGASLSLGVNTVFLNNLTVNGSFAAGVYSILLNGTVAQVLGGTGTTTFYGITINNLVGVSLSSNIYVLGDWINNGVFVGGIYSVIFAGTTAQIIGGSVVTNFYSVTFQNPVSVTLHQHIYVLGSFVNTGVFYGYYSPGGVLTGYYVRFGGSVTQVVNANATTWFYHFYVDNAAGVTLASNVYIAGNYYLYSGSFAPAGYVLYFNGIGGYVQTVGGYTSLSFYGWNIVSGATVQLIQNVTLTGNFVNAGVFYGYSLVGGVYTGYTCTFGGLVAQVLSGAGAFNFWHVTWNNAVSVTLASNVYVLGNWLNSGGFAAGTYTVYFDGPAAQVIGGAVNTTFYHVSIGNAVSVSLGQPIVVLGNWLGTGIFLGNGYLTYFNGSVLQTITAGVSTRFYDLRFNNAAGVQLLSDIYLTGAWVNDGGFQANGYAVYFVGSALQTIGGTSTTSFHHLTIGPGANVRIDRAVTVLGNWTTNGTFLANGYVVTFAGTVNQIIGGTVVVPFYGIVITNAVSVTLAQDIRVRGGWTNNGVFAPATYTVYFDGTAAQVVGGSVSTTFYHLTIANAVGVSITGPIFIGGNLVNNGLFSCEGYLVTFNGAAAQTIGGSSVTIFGGVTFNNAVGLSLLQDIRVRGDFRNLAVFAAGGHVVYFDGSVAQGIYCPSGTLTFADVTFANLAGVTLYNNVFVTGMWVNNGGFAHGGYLVTFNGTVLQTIGGSVPTTFYHFAIGSTAIVRPLYNLTILGDWMNGGTYQHNNLLVTFSGTVAQTLGGTVLTAFYDVTFNNAVSVSLGYDIDVVRHFVNSGGFCGCGHRTRFNGSVAQSITCTSGRTHFHDLTFSNAAGVTLLDGIYVSGLWVNDGGYLSNNQLVVFDGTVLQTIGGTALTGFWSVKITNAVNVQLLHDIVVGGYWLNNGVFTGNGYLTTFNGTAQQTITTSGTGSKTTFHHVTWANMVGCVLAGDVYVTGNWLCNGPFDPATWTVYFNGTTAQTCGGSTQLNFYGLNVSNTLGVTWSKPVYLYGNFVNTGLVNVGPYAWYCVGSTAQTIGGVSTTPIRFYDLYIQNAAGVTATDDWLVTHLLTLPTGNLASNGHLMLTSNADGTAMVVNPPGGGVVTGAATMERFITGVGSVGYRHYSSPMQLGTAVVSEFADDLPTWQLNPAYNTVGNAANPFPTFFQYDETRLTTTATNYFDRGWMVPTATDNLLPGRGYSAMTDPSTVVDITGTLQTGPVSYALSRGGQSLSGYQLLGNPYPAPIDWDLVPNATGLDKTLYVFKPTGKYTGSYSSYAGGIGQNGGTKDLAAMQGFFVRTTAPTATLAMTNAVRATSYLSPTFNRTAETRPILRLEARSAAGLADEAVLYFEPGAGAGYQPNQDAYKLRLNADGRPTLWSNAGADALAINGLESLATAGVVPLGVRVSVAGPHTLVLASKLNVPVGTQVTLEDRLLNRRQNLALDSVYRFTSHPDSTRQRFYLWLSPAGALASQPGTAAHLSTALYPNPTATGQATLEVVGLQPQAPVAAELFDALGRTVQRLSLPVRQGVISQVLDLRELPSGIYTLRLHPQEGVLVRKLVRE